MGGQPGFFDIDDRLRRLSDLGDQLEAFRAVLDFEIFRPELDAALAYSDGAQGGRPPFDPVMMSKILVIQATNNLSDERAEFLINDRLSFMRFLGLGLPDRIPDARTIWLFREKLTNVGWGLLEAAKVHVVPFPESDAELIAEGCAQIRHMRDTRGLLPEPDWHNCIGVLARCVDGEKFAHEWSKGDERYSHAETQAKIDRTLRETTGPTKCETFIGLGNGRCEGCPVRGKITSPIELGRRPYDPAVASAPKGLKWVLTQKGLVRERHYPNAVMALAALGVECHHDVFHDRKLVAGDVTDNLGPELSDAIARAVRERVIAQFDFDPGKDNIQEALERACERVRVDPMADYFDALKWAGQPRLDRWLATYLGAEDTPLNRAFGRKTLLAMLVLEGAQGAGKSSALRILAGG